MKILMVSMPTLHFFRWTDQLKNEGHEVYWFNITDSRAYVDKLDWVDQKYGWRLKYNYPGRIRLKKVWPYMERFLAKYNQNDTAELFEDYLITVKPDVVHSFALYVSCTPILGVMQKYPSIKWVYSSWGSDLYYFKNIPSYLKDIKNVLPRVDYLFTDCKRDYQIAKDYGFKGRFLGVYPGGGGFKLESIEKLESPNQRDIILVKGFQGRSGRAITILKAILQLKEVLESYSIIVFGAEDEVLTYSKLSKLNTWQNYKMFGKIKHEAVLDLMQQSKLYIGNSNSDGMPNTMLEALCYGAFPIQSNPGGATEEIITHGVNGLLINDCENEDEIALLIKEALTNPALLKKAFSLNMELRNTFKYETIKSKVNQTYLDIIP